MRAISILCLLVCSDGHDSDSPPKKLLINILSTFAVQCALVASPFLSNSMNVTFLIIKRDNILVSNLISLLSDSNGFQTSCALKDKVTVLRREINCSKSYVTLPVPDSQTELSSYYGTFYR